MSRLEELRARKKAKRNQEKKLYSLESELTELTKGVDGASDGASVSFVSPVPGNIQFFSQPAHATGSTLLLTPAKEAAQAPADRNSENSTSSNPIEPDQATLEPPDRENRLCYQCRHFQRSAYGFPLGLCKQRDNRPQHSTSRPTQFGCGEFTFRQAIDDSKTCTECRHYNPLSTMCSVVNTGCPYPSIPPCTGAQFQQRLQVIQSNKEVAK